MVPMLSDQELEQQMTEALRDLDIERFDQLATEADQRQNNRRQRLSHPNAMLSSALWYAGVGIAVFPLRPRGKEPITPHGFKDATVDQEQIRQWWTRTPAANIGAPAGHLFDVLDIDGPAGYMSLGQMRERGVLPPPIGRAWTPGNPPERPSGMHYFIAPTGDGNTTALLPGVDYRGMGGYVVMPPSMAANGNRYEWLVPLRMTK